LIQNQKAVIDVISAGQVNAQVPDGIGIGNVTLQVVNPIGSSDPFTIGAAVRAPALLAPPSFSAGGRYYGFASFVQDGVYVGKANLVPGAAFRPATAGDQIILYGVGFGMVSPAVSSGMVDTQNNALPNFSFQIGGVNAAVAYAGLTQGSVGLYAIIITVPSGLTGDQLLSVSVDGVAVQQTLFLTLQ
jgi:uncharacterized protein (TIGR03437 family)